MRTHFKPTETFQYTHFSSCHPTGVKRGFFKGEALRLLRTNSSKKRFDENKNNFKAKLLERGYPENFIKNILSEVNFEDRGKALLQKEKENKRILSFVTQYQPSVPNLKQILLNKWHLIEEHPALKEIFKGKPLISYRKGRSSKDILVKAKLWLRLKHAREPRSRRPVNPIITRMQSTIEAQCTMNLSELVVRQPKEVQPFTYFSVLKSYRNEVLGTHPSLFTVPTTPFLKYKNR